MRKNSMQITCSRIVESSGDLRNTIDKRVLVPDLRVIKNRDKIYRLQFFAHLLALILAGQSRFLMLGLLVGLTVGLAIIRAILTMGDVIVGLIEWSLWNKLIIFLRYWTANNGS